MTQKEKIEIIIKKIAIMDDHFEYMRSMVERLEDRVIYLEDQLGAQLEDRREIVFESEWPSDADDFSDDDDDDNED